MSCCSRAFDDNIILFTDGMANEGVADSTELLSEIERRTETLKEDCHFDDDYVIKIATLGTGGFLPELIYDIGQTYSSDPFYFLDDRCVFVFILIFGGTGTNESRGTGREQKWGEGHQSGAKRRKQFF